MNYKKIFKSKRLRFKILSFLKFIPDEPMLKLQYRIKQNKALNLKNPQRYTEKMQWYKLHYRDNTMVQCADKYTVRDYVKSKGLEDILNELYCIFYSSDDINLDSLPNEFIMKLSNGSSTNYICEDKSKCNLEEIKENFRHYLKQAGSSAGREWVYGKSKPVILAEKLLKTDSENGLADYKILCFNGKPEYVICVSGRGTPTYNHVIYDTNWKKVDVKIGDSFCDYTYDRPKNFDKMMEIAEILSADFPAARIDLYNIDGKIYFGEITFFPWSGYMYFTPDYFDYDLGDKFILPKANN